jgi:3-hydroxy-3-methylglutaryl CoA synthase
MRKDRESRGILSFGAFIPRRRLQRAAIAAAHAWAFPALKGLAKGERSMCGWDEDAVTMAVEAGRDCLGGLSAGAVSALTLASTTAPYADLGNVALLAPALGLSASVAGQEAGGSTRAGLSALIAALRSTEPGVQLVLASERRSAKPGSVQEMQYGCGAAALAAGSGDPIAQFLGAETLTLPFFHQFRGTGADHDYAWEERWARDEGVAKMLPPAVSALLKRIGRTAMDIAHFGLAGGPSGSDRLAAAACGIPKERVLPDLQAQVGATGVAHAPLLLVAALERAAPGELIVVGSFSQGCEVAAFEMLRKPGPEPRGLAGTLADRIEETAYLRLLSSDGHLDLDWGMRAETDNKTALTQLYRSADQILGFVGGKCSGCGAVQFPRMPSCVNCAAVETQAPYVLADQPAKVATFTADWLQYCPSPPLHIGLVQFDVGARLLMEIVDVGPAGLEVGMPLKMSFRIKERDRVRGFNRYFWKATPAG